MMYSPGCTDLLPPSDRRDTPGPPGMSDTGWDIPGWDIPGGERIRTQLGAHGRRGNRYHY